MHINHTVTRMSSDWVSMRLIVNRMTDRCLWQYYLPLWSVIIHFNTNNSKRKFTLNESENFNSIWKTRWISQESVRNRCHFPTRNVNISVAISYHYLPTTISFLIWSRKCNFQYFFKVSYNSEMGHKQCYVTIQTISKSWSFCFTCSKENLFNKWKQNQRKFHGRVEASNEHLFSCKTIP